MPGERAGELAPGVRRAAAHLAPADAAAARAPRRDHQARRPRVVRPGACDRRCAAWNVWRFMLRNFSWLVSSFGRVEVSGSIPEELRTGPLLLAANHIGDFDPFVIAVALHKLGVIPRIMAT